MTIELWLKNAINVLESASVPTARLDAEVLLADVLNKDRSWLLAHPEHMLQRSDLRILDAMVDRRKRHEPLAYIRGKQEFYGREFIVSPDTLTPRPETETMIELLLQQIEDWRLEIGEKSSQNEDKRKKNERSSNFNPLSVVDIGTGSGCIIITAALELSSISNPQSPISYLGLDISEPALKIARKNANNLGVKVDFQQFDLTKNSLIPILNPQSSILILANLPYIPEDFHINVAASHEPEFAIFGGRDGLDYYRYLFKQVADITKDNNLLVITESMPPQHLELRQIAKASGFHELLVEDFIQVFTQQS